MTFTGEEKVATIQQLKIKMIKIIGMLCELKVHLLKHVLEFYLDHRIYLLQ